MPGVYEIYVKDHFAAAHALRGYDGNCSNMHGHNWIVEAYIRCPRLNKLGIGIDFRDVKEIVKDVLDKLDHTTLNEVVEFSSINPTPENLSKLFTPFTRLDTRYIEGHGLGLSIVQRIVEKLGGEVGVKSAVGQGSVFSFTLPRAK